MNFENYILILKSTNLILKNIRMNYKSDFI